MTPIARLVEIVAALRAENGCPWDRKQTLESVKQYLVEECYEVIEAIDSGEPARHREELGDLLLQVVFHARLQEERGAFSFDAVVENVCEKLVRRHPHVFGDTRVADSEEVLRNWEAIKAEEKKKKSAGEGAVRSVVDGAPRHLPALYKADQVQSRAARVGFDWDKIGDVLAKVDEELAEVKSILAGPDRDGLDGEIGDLLFAVVNFARFNGISSEDALNGAIAKFIRRFKEVEKRVRAQGREMSGCTLAEMDEHWNAVKADENDLISAACQPGSST